MCSSDLALSLLLALLLNMLLGLSGQAWLPDLLAVVLMFWIVHQPLRVGLTTAFVLGLALDVHESALLGQNALAYVCMGFFATAVHRRVLWFPLREQTVQVLPVFGAAERTSVCVHLATAAVAQGRGVVVRRMDGYGLPNALRMTIGSAEANEATLAALADFLKG